MIVPIALVVARAVESLQLCWSAAMAPRSMMPPEEDWTGRRPDTVDVGEEEQALVLPPSFAGGGKEGSCPGGPRQGVGNDIFAASGVMNVGSVFG